MNLDSLIPSTGEWLRGTGPEADIVVSTRIRLARNLAAFPFTNRASPHQKAEIETQLRERIVRPFHRDRNFNHTGRYFFDNGRKAVAVLHIPGQRVVVDLDMQWGILCPFAIFSAVDCEARCDGKR